MNVTYNYLFPFERNNNGQKHHDWLSENWTLSIYIAFIYIIIVFTGQAYMKNRPPFRLQKFLVVWNIGLSVFSLIGSVRFISDGYRVFQSNGAYGVICSRCYKDDDVVLFWAYLFVYSKVLELGDTLFVILRKQNLIALQWYHHFATMIYTWYSFVDYPSVARLFSSMNFSIHTVMYFYYALRGLKIKPPSWIPYSITIAQIIQMFFGLAITIYVYWLKISGDKCEVNLFSMKLALGLYFTLAVLFLKFFSTRYFKNKESEAKKD